MKRKCSLCYSPLRQEIEFLIEKKVTLSDLAKKYHKAIGIAEKSMYVSLMKHKRKKHPPVIDTTPVDDTYVQEAAQSPQTFDEYAKRLLNVGFKNMDPSKVSHSHVISAQRTILEERKINNEMDMQKKFLMMFFRGKSLVEGEVVDEPIKQLRAEAVSTDTD